jgi:hypothetical protein
MPTFPLGAVSPQASQIADTGPFDLSEIPVTAVSNCTSNGEKHPVRQGQPWETSARQSTPYALVKTSDHSHRSLQTASVITK